ncbi:FecR domain-containing protein [Stappia sp. F7233]|uniref:FecR domain-containing protein n=1 Tax=Stappia albiluteola TaxID=2758565 RepID=A0A839AE17_9HYPH|nr:FecR family protein [Stappia albiluteola]MBA5776849.1 FecR domain-containing protein [Stappia albiluteola]
MKYCVKQITTATRLLAGLFLVFAFLGPATAEGERWEIRKASGQVYLVSPEVPAFRARAGMYLEPGFTIATRQNGRALIARGESSILVGPDTAFALSAYQSSDRATTLLQRSGRIEIEVEKRTVPHFKVETPYLAAVVKGTRFTVTVGKDAAAVDVSRGLVEVSDFASGDTADVKAGQKASSKPGLNPGLSVSGIGTVERVRKAPPQAPSFLSGKVSPAAAAAASSAAGRSAGGLASAGGTGQGGTHGNAGGKSAEAGNNSSGGNGGKGGGSESASGKGGGNGGGNGGGHGRN